MSSAHLAWKNISKSQPVTLRFVPIASYGYAEWIGFFRDVFEKHPKKFLSNILSDLLPRRFSEVFIREYFPLLQEKYVGGLGRVDREKVAKLLGEGIEVTLLERRPGDEFVTAGGVHTDEIHATTCESKLRKNLYFAGEILNVDGYTGGFSLQICWSSGYVAGVAISEILG
jgi:predicted flavoprotein YhiN